jgi:hypothetical protein
MSFRRHSYDSSTTTNITIASSNRGLETPLTAPSLSKFPTKVEKEHKIEIIETFKEPDTDNTILSTLAPHFPLGCLPDEILISVFSFLRPEDLHDVVRVQPTYYVNLIFL